LLRTLDIPALLDFRHAEDLAALTHARDFEEEGACRDQLAEVLV
jgi:hypothetical protein